MDVEAISEWRGQDVVDPDDRKIGRLEEIYYDRHTDAPGFACVATGLFGRRLTFVPLQGAAMARNHVRVAYPVALVKDAPNVEPDGQLTVAEEEALFAHYGLQGALGGDTVSPRLVRYQTQAAAAQVAQAREVVADQGPEPVALAASVDHGGTGGPERRLGRNPVVGRGAETVYEASEPADYDAAPGDDEYAPAAVAHDAGETDRLHALEQRVAAIETWLASQSAV
ncbi:MAG TPA: PRC-barrel domain-containing protein [Solirubrobacteraceae bacterium]|nr:PRC-barrel domain-containing protein [Solirubrobacteraceae bacterium]